MKAVRIALVVLGLAVAVYGVASLTGGWLGTPPWWAGYLGADYGPYTGGSRWQVFKGRDVVSASVVVAGLALAILAAFAAWPRRPKRAPPA